jgi:hypothetical protein
MTVLTFLIAVALFAAKKSLVTTTQQQFREKRRNVCALTIFLECNESFDSTKRLTRWIKRNPVIE